MDTTLGILADFAASLTFGDLPGGVVHETKRRLLDYVGCALGAFPAEPVQAARRLACGVLGRELGATLWGTEHLSAPDLTSFTNGLMGRYLDFNDQYTSRTTGHPSDIIPAALGATEVAAAGGPEAISATVVGYEVFCRLCDATDIRAYWDHSTLGAIASAAAAANALRLSAKQAAHAISLATVSNNALGQTRRGELSDWKAGAFPNAARQGVFAALLAREGVTGPDQPFEGPQGFWAAVSQPFDLAPLGNPFKITETAIKQHSGCYLGLSALDAMIDIGKQLETPGAIRDITVHTYRYGIDMTADSPAKWRPQTRETADHSLPFMLAIALLEGAVGPQHYTPQHFTDPRILALMDKVKVHEDRDYTARFPAAQIQRVEVLTTAGSHLAKQIDFPKGHPENPMTNTELLSKYQGLTAPYLSQDQVDTTRQILQQMETQHDLRPLYQAMVIA